MRTEMTYLFLVDSKSGVVDVWWQDGEFKNSVPHVLNTEFTLLAAFEKVTLRALTHYFGHEQDAEVKARLLTPGVTKRLAKLARIESRRNETKDGRQGLLFTVTTDKLDEIVCAALLDYAPDSAGIEYIGGTRRDLIREQSRLETTGRLLN
jgi:hypothetical protein